MLYLLVELGIAALFIVNILLAKRAKRLDLLIISTVFAALFENLHVYLFQNYTGGYYYSSQFLLMAYKVPLFVILSWGIIILNAYLIATKITNKVAKIFLTPVLVVMVDLALEFFAVKQEYWTWVGYEATQGLFGVPASNFISWMLITLALVFCYEELKEKWIVPVVAYILFVFMSTIMIIATDLFNIDINQQAYIVWLMIAVFAVITLALWNAEKKEEIKDEDVSTALASRGIYYIFSLALALTSIEVTRRVWPILVYAYLIEAAITIAVYYEKRKKIISSFSFLNRNSP